MKLDLFKNKLKEIEFRKQKLKNKKRKKTKYYPIYNLSQFQPFSFFVISSSLFSMISY